MTSRKFPILFTDNFFLFPKYEALLNIDEDYKKNVLACSLKESNGYLLIINDKIKGLSEYSQRGILAKIVLNTTSSIDQDAISKSFKQIKLLGMKRIKLVNSEKRDEVH
jgi:ATP-dependent Lon protease